MRSYTRDFCATLGAGYGAPKRLGPRSSLQTQDRCTRANGKKAVASCTTPELANSTGYRKGMGIRTWPQRAICGMTLHVYSDGKIISETTLWDVAAVLRQIGVVK